MDNRIFNVNGEGLDMLKSTLALAFRQNSDACKCIGYIMDKDKGLVFLWSQSSDIRYQRMLCPLSAESCAEMAFEWLSSDEAESITRELWDADDEHDGSNSEGWRVYCEDWGHVSGLHEAIVAVRKAYMWHGK